MQYNVPEKWQKVALALGAATSVNSGNVAYKKCPFCGREDSKFSVNWEKGVFYCSHGTCPSHSATIKANIKNLGQHLGVIKEKRKPKEIALPIEPIGLNNMGTGTVRPNSLPMYEIEKYSDAKKYMETRGINPDDCKDLGLKGIKTPTDGAVIAIPYFDINDDLSYYRYRYVTPNTEKGIDKYWCTGVGKPGSKNKKTWFPWGINNVAKLIKNSKRYNIEVPSTLYITEGEFDAISLRLCGFDTAISLPSGTGSFDVIAIPEISDIVSEFKEIYLLTDNDEAGEKCKKNIAKLIDTQRIKLYELNNKTYNDVNEMLVSLGREATRDLILSCKQKYTLGNTANLEEYTFWEAHPSDYTKVKIAHKNILGKVMSSLGYCYYLDKTSKNPVYRFVQIKNGIASDKQITDLLDLKQWIIDYTKDTDWESYAAIIWNAILFSKGLFDDLLCNELRRLEDTEMYSPRGTKETEYFYFTNGWVCIKRGEPLKINPYPAPHVIWDYEVIPKTWNPVSKDVYSEHPFVDFFNKVFNNDPAKIGIAKWGIGYMLSSYFDPATPLAVFLYDENADNFTREGGRGKSLLLSIIGLESYSLKYGKSYRLESSSNEKNFAFQGLSSRHQVVTIDDIPQEFNFTKLYPNITGTGSMDQKFSSRFDNIISNTPKFIISSNFLNLGCSSSTTRRIYAIPVSDYWQGKNVRDYYNQTFFNEWEKKDWDCYYSFLLEDVFQTFLTQPRPSDKTEELDRLIIGLMSEYPTAGINYNSIMELNTIFDDSFETSPFYFGGEFIQESEYAISDEIWKDKILYVPAILINATLSSSYFDRLTAGNADNIHPGKAVVAAFNKYLELRGLKRINTITMRLPTKLFCTDSRDKRIQSQSDVYTGYRALFEWLPDSIFTIPKFWGNSQSDYYYGAGLLPGTSTEPIAVYLITSKGTEITNNTNVTTSRLEKYLKLREQYKNGRNTEDE